MKNKQYLSNLSDSVEIDNELELLYTMIQTIGFLEHSQTIYTGIYWQYENGVYKFFFTSLEDQNSSTNEMVYEYNNHYTLEKEEGVTVIERLVKLRNESYLANIRGDDIYVYEK